MRQVLTKYGPRSIVEPSPAVMADPEYQRLAALELEAKESYRQALVCSEARHAAVLKDAWKSMVWAKADRRKQIEEAAKAVSKGDQP